MELSIHQLHDLHKDLGANEIILDVRSPDEFAAGHIEGAINIPHDQVIEHVDELREKNKIYIHCKSGGRAKRAFDALSELGLSNLVCISGGGIDLWAEAGYPVNQ